MKNIIKKLNQAGCNVVVVPYNTPVEEILKYKPNGFLISNGPGNPYDLNEIIENIRFLVGKKPILGIGLGCELIGIAYGVKVSKMKCGHHGSNYPVKNIKTGKVEITSQNYSYTFDEESIQKSDLVITKVNVITKEAKIVEFEDGLEFICVNNKKTQVGFVVNRRKPYSSRLRAAAMRLPALSFSSSTISRKADNAGESDFCACRVASVTS